MPIKIGRVFISSGRAITATKQTLDWAFVDVDATVKTTYDNEDRKEEGGTTGEFLALGCDLESGG